MSQIDKVLQGAVNEVNQVNDAKADVTQTEEKKKVIDESLEAETPEDKQLDLISEEAPKKEKKKYKVPVKTYGKEKEIEIDEDQIPEYVQKGHSATEKWKEAVKIREEIQAKEKWIKDWEDTIKNNPDVYFEQLLGKDKASSFYESKVLSAYEMEKMSPEQRELYQVKDRIAKARKEEEEITSKAQARKDQEMEQYAMQRLDQMSKSSLKKAGIENPTPFVFRKYLDFIRPYLENADNVTEQDMDLLSAEFSKRNSQEQSQQLDSMDETALANFLGKKNVEKVRRYLMGLSGKKPTLETEAPKKEEPKFKSMREYYKTL